MKGPPNAPPAWSYDAHQRRQARLGLQLTPAERLRWLEDTLEEMRRYLGRAASARGAPDGRPEDLLEGAPE